MLIWPYTHSLKPAYPLLPFYSHNTGSRKVVLIKVFLEIFKSTFSILKYPQSFLPQHPFQALALLSPLPFLECLQLTTQNKYTFGNIAFKFLLRLHYNNVIASISFPSSNPSLPSFKFMASFSLLVVTCINIPIYNFLSLYNAFCMFVVSIDHSVFDNQLVGSSSLGKIFFPTLSIPHLLVLPFEWSRPHILSFIHSDMSVGVVFEAVILVRPYGCNL